MRSTSTRFRENVKAPPGVLDSRSEERVLDDGRTTARGGRVPLLTVKGLKTHFQTQEGTVRAVDGVDFTLGEGESLGLAGESGCGKTTAALSIMRLLPSKGKLVEGTIDYVGFGLAKVLLGRDDG